MKKELTTLAMVDYDQVKEEARISFYAPEGDYRKLWIKRVTFDKLLKGGSAWETNKYGDPHKFQQELRNVVLQEVKHGEHLIWFDANRDRIQINKARG